MTFNFHFQISSNSSMPRNLVSGVVTLPGVGASILGLPGSSETARLKTGAHPHNKIVHHVVGKKTTVGGGGLTGTIKAGAPPPIPPNKPAMSAIYKPMAAAAAAAMKVDASGEQANKKWPE